ncbi:hypothetical protein HMPREF9012_2166 [Bacteroidetes bacterium oral taxon 272 str. F0290]|nr:hypothetical protein HMPREF9012_2166 [Bacteroidetes bacterium oral taxon 272 str. F0290]
MGAELTFQCCRVARRERTPVLPISRPHDEFHARAFREKSSLLFAQKGIEKARTDGSLPPSAVYCIGTDLHMRDPFFLFRAAKINIFY